MAIHPLGYCLICLFSFITTLPAQTNESFTGQWQVLPATDGSELIERTEAAFVRVGKKFFLMGSRGIKPISIYDVKKGVWTQGSAPPIEIHHFQPKA